MKENRELELKLIITNTFLKTVSAFANYGSGRIIFGVDDNGVVGIDDLDETCLNLENKINDNIVPKPNFSFIKNNRDKTITLVVKEGLDKPYLYKGKAYKRNDTSTIEVDRLELNRLTLEGMNRYFEELRSNDQNLKFEVLKKELIPEKAFREVIANAIIHRTWDINSNIRISMFENRIEVVSPGGLPSGITEKEYLNGQISQLRNPILGNVFFRLKYIEMFGTGIRRINEIYRNYSTKPIYEINENSIKITLFTIFNKIFLSKDEKIVFETLKDGNILSNKEISEITGFKKDKNLKLLKSLVEKKYIVTIGNGRGTKYYKN